MCMGDEEYAKLVERNNLSPAPERVTPELFVGDKIDCVPPVSACRTCARARHAMVLQRCSLVCMVVGRRGCTRGS